MFEWIMQLKQYHVTRTMTTAIPGEAVVDDIDEAKKHQVCIQWE